MKKIITLISFLIIAQFSIAQQQIDSITVNPILCSGGDTTVIVYTNVTSTFEYFYEILNNPPPPAQPFWQPAGNPVTVNSPNTSFTIPNLFATTYRVTIQSPNGVVVFDTDTFVVNQPGPIWQAAPTQAGNVSCFGMCDGTAQVFMSGGTPNMTGGTPTYNYTWSPVQPNTNILSGLCVGTYLCTVTDANGCVYSGNPIIVPITGPSVLSASITYLVNPLLQNLL